MTLHVDQDYIVLLCFEASFYASKVALHCENAKVTEHQVEIIIKVKGLQSVKWGPISIIIIFNSRIKI